MDSDDRTIGRILSRREILALLGVAGVGVVAARRAGATWTTPQDPAAGASGPMRLPACVVRPEQTEGPYFVDEKLNRADIRSDPASGTRSEGAPLALDIRVSKVTAGACAPLAGAIVDVWQCDGAGVYSDVRDTNGFFDTRGQKFLRGHQVTNASGSARFTTIYPGWYRGRTVHIHFKIRASGSTGRSHEFTSQLYFDDTLSDQVFKHAPYVSNQTRRTRNDRDGIFRSGGQQLLLAVEAHGEGYSSTFDIGLQMD